MNERRLSKNQLTGNIIPSLNTPPIIATATTNSSPNIHENHDAIAVRRITSQEPIENSVEPLSKKQIHPNSCGACSLLVAAKELGVKKMPDISGFKTSMMKEEELGLTNICEEDIYTITSGSTSYRTQQPQLDKAGYSMPQGIITAARLLGLEAKVTKNNSTISNVLPYIYPQVEEECKGMGSPVQLESAEDKDSYRLTAVAVSLFGVPAGLHWVVSRPDGSYMDPGVGKNASNFDELNKNGKEVSKFVGYYETGISIVLNNKDEQNKNVLPSIKSMESTRDNAQHLQASGSQNSVHQQSELARGAFTRNQSTDRASSLMSASEPTINSLHSLEALKTQTIFRTRDNLQYFEQNLSSSPKASLTQEEAQIFQQTMRNAMLSVEHSSSSREHVPALKELRVYGLKILNNALERGYLNEVSSLLNDHRSHQSEYKQSIFNYLIEKTLSEKESTIQNNMTLLLGGIISKTNDAERPILKMIDDHSYATQSSVGMIYKEHEMPASRYLLKLVPKEDKEKFLANYKKPGFIDSFYGIENLKPLIKKDIKESLPLLKGLSQKAELQTTPLSRTNMEKIIHQETKRIDDWRVDNAKREAVKRTQIKILKDMGLSDSAVEDAVRTASHHYGNQERQTTILKAAIAKHESKIKEDNERTLRLNQMEEEHMQRRNIAYIKEENRREEIRMEKEFERAQTQHNRQKQEAFQAQQAQRLQQQNMEQEFKKAQQLEANRALTNKTQTQNAITQNSLNRSVDRQAIAGIHRPSITMNGTNQSLTKASTNQISTITYQEQETVKASEVNVFGKRGEKVGKITAELGQHIEISKVDERKMQELSSSFQAGSGSVQRQLTMPGTFNSHRGGLSIQAPKNETQKILFKQVNSGVYDKFREPKVDIHIDLERQWRNLLK